MKRGILVLAIMLLLLPSTLANITINVPSNKEFNVGDNIKLTGSISNTEPLSGYLLLSVVCNDNKFSLQPVKFKLSANEEKSFPTEINIPKSTATLNMVGTCYAMAEIMVNNEITETSSSEEFEVKKNLRGSFSPNDLKIQLGQELTINGIVQKLDGSPLNGKAEIYFNYNTINYLVDITDIINGNLKFNYKPNNIPTGVYDIEVLARDINGNEEKFKAAKFELTDRLNVYATTDSLEYSPGDTIKINGEVNDVKQEPVKLSTAYITFDNDDYTAKIENNKVSYNLKLPENIKSGEHAITLTANDENGNHGNAVLNIKIKQIPTTLKAELDSKIFEPNDVVIITPQLYDQANEPIDELIELKILNDDQEMFSNLVPNNDKVKFNLPSQAQPGEWDVIVKASNLKTVVKFTVKEVSGLAATVTGNVVNIKNTGNVKFKDKLNFELKNDQDVIEFKQKVKLNPGEVKAVALNKKAPTGDYVLNLFLPQGMQTFDVTLTEGIKKRDWSLILNLIIALLVATAAYFASVHLPKRRNKKADKKTLTMAAKKVYQKRDEIQKDERERLSAIEDFKQRTLKEIKKVEEKEKKEKSKPSWLRDNRAVTEQPSNEKNDDGFGNASGFFNSF